MQTMATDFESNARSSGPASPPTSRLARWAWAAWLTLIVYGSLTPWSGWRDAGVSAFSYLTAPWPRHLTYFDAVANVLAYVPLGGLSVLALYPRLRGSRAVLAAAALGVVLSTAMEALQTFLPARVASNVDLLTNGIGAALGACLAAPFAERLIGGGVLASISERWIARDVAPALVLMALWPLAQIDPGPMLFGNGHALPIAVPTGIGAIVATQQPAPPSPRFPPAAFMLAESLVTLAGLLGAGLALFSILRPQAQRYSLAFILCAAGLLAKTLAYGAAFGSEYALVWATPGALVGLALGGALMALMALSARWRPLALARASLGCLCILVVAVNVVPPNPYHAAWIEQWNPGKLRHYSAAATWLSAAWPYAMLTWLVYGLFARRAAQAGGT